ncbi:MAG TPA: type II secretion system protein [Steroidobacteraceae bacterium]|nr:type II secretion system protein [Steroidobacteraceae bacterium]
MSSRTRCRGVTLVELVVTIVVITAAVSAVLAIVSSTAARSAENLVQTQAVMVAESYLSEILQKPYGRDCVTPCARTAMDKVGDYDRLFDNGVHDATGTSVAGLAAYTIQVNVASASIGAVPAEFVTVTVTPPNGATVVLDGYRMQVP